MKIELLRSRASLQTRPERRLQRQTPLRHRHFIGGANLFHDALDKKIEDLQLAGEGPDEVFIALDPHDNLWKHVMPAEEIDPTPLRNVELTLQLRPETFVNLSGKPVSYLGLRQRSFDFQKTFVADEPIGTASYRTIVIGDETDSLNGYVLIEFVPIDRLGLDDQAALHRGRIIKLDPPLQ